MTGTPSEPFLLIAKVAAFCTIAAGVPPRPPSEQGRKPNETRLTTVLMARDAIVVDTAAVCERISSRTS